MSREGCREAAPAAPRGQLGLEFWIHPQGHPELTVQARGCSPRAESPPEAPGWGSSSGHQGRGWDPPLPQPRCEPGGGAQPALPDRTHASPASQRSRPATTPGRALGDLRGLSAALTQPRRAEMDLPAQELPLKKSRRNPKPFVSSPSWEQPAGGWLRGETGRGEGHTWGQVRRESKKPAARRFCLHLPLPTSPPQEILRITGAPSRYRPGQVGWVPLTQGSSTWGQEPAPLSTPGAGTQPSQGSSPPAPPSAQQGRDHPDPLCPCPRAGGQQPQHGRDAERRGRGRPGGRRSRRRAGPG